MFPGRTAVQVENRRGAPQLVERPRLDECEVAHTSPNLVGRAKGFIALLDFRWLHSAELNPARCDALGNAVVDCQGIQNVFFVTDDPRVHHFWGMAG